MKYLEVLKRAVDRMEATSHSVYDLEVIPTLLVLLHATHALDFTAQLGEPSRPLLLPQGRVLAHSMYLGLDAVVARGGCSGHPQTAGSLSSDGGVAQIKLAPPPHR